MTTDRPTISVIVASNDARASIEACLDRLVAQAPGSGAEIVIVDNSTDGTTEIIRNRYAGRAECVAAPPRSAPGGGGRRLCRPADPRPGRAHSPASIRLVVASPSALIPELWAAGIHQSTGDIIAITTAHCVPDPSWLTGMLKAHKARAPAIGGAIENEKSAGVVEWAVYFCRYSRYMLPFPEGFVEEIAGDNASYKRADIDRCRHAWRDGFWEPAVHAALRQAGLRLLLVPSLVVYHRKSFGVWRFMQQRFQHGRQFGGERASRLGRRKRALYVALSPAIPLVFLVRITSHVLTKRRHRRELLLSLPILTLFLWAWALGEWIGYLRGSTR
jgi:glycosyltransferase involved in cell wall biosynthesis